jgi:predicted transcriptional regulator
MKNTRSESGLEAKWGLGALSLGWTPVPTALLFLQADLGLNPVDMNILINLLSHWWRASDKIYPSQDAIAKRIGVSKRTVQRSIDKMELLKIIEVQMTKRSSQYKGRNIYNLKPLALLLDQNGQVLRDKIEMARIWKRSQEE